MVMETGMFPLGGGPGSRVVSGESSEVRPALLMAHRLVLRHGGRLGQGAGEEKRGILPLSSPGVLRVLPSRNHPLQRCLVWAGVRLAPQGSGHSLGSHAHRRAHKLERVVPNPVRPYRRPGSHPHHGIRRVGHVLAHSQSSSASGGCGGGRNSIRHSPHPGGSIHPRRVLFHLGRRVESLVLWMGGVRVHFLKRGAPLYRKAGLEAWKMWASPGFGRDWCYLLDRPDLFSQSQLKD